MSFEGNYENKLLEWREIVDAIHCNFFRVHQCCKRKHWMIRETFWLENAVIVSRLDVSRVSISESWLNSRTLHVLSWFYVELHAVRVRVSSERQR